MKTSIAIALMCTAMSSAHSAGPYDGIYQVTTGSQEWISVQTNGSTAVLTHYFVQPVSGLTFDSDIGKITPSQANSWDLLIGSWNGNTLSVSGQIQFNACAIVATAVFAGSTTSVTINSAQNTTTGTRSGINCSVMNNSKFQFNKIF